MNSTLSLGNIKLASRNSTESPEIDAGLFSRETEAFLSSLYCIIGVFALILNGFISYLVLKKKVKRSPFNHLLLLLSISDMAAVIFMSPYIFVNLRKLTGYSQEFLNILCGFTIGLTPYWICTCVSVFILCLISVNRYFLINYPTRALWLKNVKTIWLLFEAFWVIACIIMMPNLFAFTYDQKTGLCYRNWPPGFNAAVYSFVTAIIGMVIPISCMTYTFIATVISLRRGKCSQGTQIVALRARKHVVTLLGILIIAYFVSSLPMAVYWIMSLATNFFPEGIKGHYLRKKVVRIVVLSPMSNTAMDPLIYAFRSNEFKHAILGIFSKSKKTKGLTNTAESRLLQQKTHV